VDLRAAAGAIHDLTAARIWDILRELAASGLVVLADKGYHGAGDHIRTPCKGGTSQSRSRRPTAPTPNYAAPANPPTPSSRPRHIVCKLRCCPWQAGQLAKPIHVLQIRETRGRNGLTVACRAQWRKPWSRTPPACRQWPVSLPAEGCTSTSWLPVWLPVTGRQCGAGRWTTVLPGEGIGRRTL
jgi:hypothetical protein